MTPSTLANGGRDLKRGGILYVPQLALYERVRKVVDRLLAVYKMDKMPTC